MIPPIDNMVITHDTIFSPGSYLIPSGITITGSDIAINGNGAVLIGRNFKGTGIHISGGKNITIENLTLHNFYHGIKAENCRYFNIAKCSISRTHELPDNSIFLDIWIPADQAYGGGILLNQVENGQIVENNLSHQMNGLQSYGCSHLRVEKNTANYCSGWGFHLNQTSDSTFINNIADFCCRYEPRGSRIGHMGADAAGFLIVNLSCRNKFLKNQARLGGDGFFLAGMNPGYELVGCDDNLFEENDGSYSPNNAFEATFSRGNIFRSNYANHSNYGFWLGFSKEGNIDNNTMIGNRQAGIAVENGINFVVKDNLFSNNRHGILLWSKHVENLERCLPENNTSRNWRITQNTFTGNLKAIRIAADQDHGVRPLPADGELGFPAPKPTGHIIRNNKFRENICVLDDYDTEGTIFEENELINNANE